MTKSTVIMFVVLMMVHSPALARSHHKHQSRVPAYSGPVYDTWKPPYQLPAGVGPNDVPFAPFWSVAEADGDRRPSFIKSGSYILWRGREVNQASWADTCAAYVSSDPRLEGPADLLRPRARLRRFCLGARAMTASRAFVLATLAEH
jgi:hypothetical protein